MSCKSYSSGFSVSKVCFWAVGQKYYNIFKDFLKETSVNFLTTIYLWLTKSSRVAMFFMCLCSCVVVVVLNEPCGWAWGTWGSRCGKSCSRYPSEDTPPSPGWTSPHGGQSAQRQQSWRGGSARHRGGTSGGRTGEEDWRVYANRDIVGGLCGCSRSNLVCVSTYGPHSTMILRTLLMPRSHTFIHSFWTSIILPWKFSCSNSMICTEDMSCHTRAAIIVSC